MLRVELNPQPPQQRTKSVLNSIFDENWSTPDEEKTEGKIGTSTNHIIVVRAMELSSISSVNMWLAVFACTHAAVSLVLFILNWFNCSHICPFHQEHQPATTGPVFHRLEFTAAFVFNVVETLALIHSPQRLSTEYKSPSSLKISAFINLLCSFTGMCLVWVNLAKFEVPSHQMEYVGDISLAFFNIMIFGQQYQKKFGKKDTSSQEQSHSMVYEFIFALCIAMLQFGIYNGCGWTLKDLPGCDGDGLDVTFSSMLSDPSLTLPRVFQGCYGAHGEWCAHCFEFIFGMFNAAVAFSLIMDNKFDADMQLCDIMEGKDISADHGGQRTSTITPRTSTITSRQNISAGK